MRLEKYISILRNIVNKYSDDDKYTDEFYYELISSARARLISNEYAKFAKKSSFDKITFCMQMCIATSHDCDCVKYGCKVLKSKYKIPRPITSRNVEQIFVATLNGKPINPMTQDDYENAQLSPVKKDTMGFEIKNGMLLLWGADINLVSPRVIEITIIPEDIIELAEVPHCTTNGQLTGETCFDVYALDLPMRKEHDYAALQLCLEMLGIKEKFPQDHTNDGTDKQL